LRLLLGIQPGENFFRALENILGAGALFGV